MKKGEALIYSTGSSEVRARVETAHRDGSITVRAMFYQNNGKDVPGYLGFKYRLWPNDPQMGVKPLSSPTK